ASSARTRLFSRAADGISRASHNARGRPLETRRRCGPIQHAIVGIGSLCQGEDDARLLVAYDEAIVPLEIIIETGVLLEPPECGLWKDEILGAAPSQILEVGDGFIASSRVETCIHSLRVSREVPCATSSKLQQFLVALADDKDRCVAWNGALHNLANVNNDPLVFLAWARTKRLSWHTVISSRTTLATEHFRQNLSEPAPDRLRAMKIHNALATLRRDPLPEGGFIDEPLDSAGERVGIVGDEHVLPRAEIQSLDADRGGHCWCADHQRLYQL